MKASSMKRRWRRQSMGTASLSNMLAPKRE